jgi:hypothetical protein
MAKKNTRKRSKSLKGGRSWDSFWNFQSSVGRATATYNRAVSTVVGYLFLLIGFGFVIAGLYQVITVKELVKFENDKDKDRDRDRDKPKSTHQIQEEGGVMLAFGVIFVLIGYASVWQGKYVEKAVKRDKMTAGVYGTAEEVGFLYNLFNSN